MPQCWTIETLKEHFEKILEEKDKYYRELRRTDSESVKTALVTAEKAVVKAEEKQDQYNKGHNDILKKMDDKLPRNEADVRDSNLFGKIDEQNKIIAALSSRLDVIAGKGLGINQLVAWVIAGIAIAGFIIKSFSK